MEKAEGSSQRPTLAAISAVADFVLQVGIVEAAFMYGQNRHVCRRLKVRLRSYVERLENQDDDYELVLPSKLLQLQPP
jgi:hypothetical protein